MKRAFATVLLLAYLVSFTEFSEVLRLPLLVKHYTEHKSKVAELSFIEFLVMHYETDVAHDDRDMRLPFKDCHHSFSAQTIVLPVQKIILMDDADNIAIIHHSFYLLHEPQILASDIFQPPKI